MPSLQDILYNVHIEYTTGHLDVDIKGLCFDSRQAKKGFLYVAIRGTQYDGHDFHKEAVDMGAVAVVCEVLPDITPDSVIYIRVKNSAQSLGFITANFYGQPSQKLKLIGVTGTNGKTTVATLLYKLLTQLGYKTGLLSTVINKIENQKEEPATHTTNDTIRIHEWLTEMVNHGCTYCVIEISSHAIVQGRIHGLHFTGALFTNISHDHLDYHGSFSEYIKAKKMLFDLLPSSAFALVNKDDKRGRIMLQNCSATHKTISLKTAADFKAKIITHSIEGLELEIDRKSIWFTLVGRFNAYNILLVYGTAVLLGEDPEKVLSLLSNIKGAPGRMEYFMSKKKFNAIVDYAHTPDALKNVLITLNQLHNSTKQIITVVGCGGNRDRKKRPIMGSLATEYSNKVIFTSDNPREEDPMIIIKDMLFGVNSSHTNKTLVIPNREEAIKTACMLADEKDIVLIAGKGHETYQEIKGTRYPFDDREIIQRMLKLFAR